MYKNMYSLIFMRLVALSDIFERQMSIAACLVACFDSWRLRTLPLKRRYFGTLEPLLLHTKYLSLTSK